jgi:hypothetical protein
MYITEKFIMPPITKFINWSAFIISFAFGVFAVYVTAPLTRKIIVYPSPDNVDILQYKDQSGQYYKFHEKKVKCPTDSTKITKTPIQA